MRYSGRLSFNNMRGFPKNFGFKLAPATQTIFTNQVPVRKNVADGQPYELGLKFKSNVNGFLIGIKFWKDFQETGSHTGRVWFNNTIIGLVEFTNETLEGWQQQSFSSKIPIEAESVYLVSVNINMYYVATSNNPLAEIIASANLATIADGNNGLYGTVIGQKPASSFNNSNYFRDIIFLPK